MLKGFLKLNVLNELAICKCTGYELMNKLCEKLGRKPSPGSIYPVLGDLSSDGYIKVKEDGRKKIYSITCKGKRIAKKLLKEKENIALKHMESIRRVGDIVGEKEVEPLIRLADMIAKHEKPALRFISLMGSQREVLMDLVGQKGYSKKEKEIRKIINESTKKLRILRDRK